MLVVINDEMFESSAVEGDFSQHVVDVSQSIRARVVENVNMAKLSSLEWFSHHEG